MNGIAMTIAMVLVIQSTSISAQTTPVRLLRSGVQHAQDVEVDSGSDWWGIFKSDDGYVLEPTPVTVAPDKTDAGFTEVKIPQSTRPLILIHGLDDLLEGRLESVELDATDTFLYPGQMRCLSWQSGDSRADRVCLAALGSSIRFDWDSAIFEDYRFVLRKHDRPNIHEQVLTRIGVFAREGAPHLIWAGDLDRDGKIDLLFDEADREFYSRYTLYLSSAAKDGELVGKVAEWTTSGC